MTIILVRHAEPVAPGDPAHEENSRPLSRRGRVQAERLADELAGEPLAAIYSSPYPRAVQTVEPLAERLSLKIGIEDDLRERLLSPHPLPDWRDHLRRAWRDFGYRLPGGESSTEAGQRVRRVLAKLAQRHRNETIAVASHGNLIALALHSAAPQGVDFAFWERIPVPAVYRLDAGVPPRGPGFDALPTGSVRSPVSKTDRSV